MLEVSGGRLVAWFDRRFVGDRYYLVTDLFVQNIFRSFASESFIGKMEI